MTAPATLLSELDERMPAVGLPYQAPESLYAPIRYILQLKAKRIRPLLVLMAHEAYAGTLPDAAYQLATGVEFFHNFTLMHDDIMDHAPLRRGEPTVHTKWNANVAILAGDEMFVEAFRLVATSFPQQSAALSAHFAQAARIVCEGQARDMDYTQAEEVSVEAYTEMIRQKTATLIGASLWLGATSGGADSATAEALYNYGLEVGTAFQLMDDYLDTFADEEKLGKQSGGDIIEGKQTYLWIRAREKATPAQRKELKYWQGVEGMDDEKVAQIRRIYKELGVDQDTRNRVARHYRSAKKHLDPLTENPGVRAIRDFLAGLMERGK